MKNSGGEIRLKISFSNKIAKNGFFSFKFSGNELFINSIDIKKVKGVKAKEFDHVVQIHHCNNRHIHDLTRNLYLCVENCTRITYFTHLPGEMFGVLFHHSTYAKLRKYLLRKLFTQITG